MENEIIRLLPAGPELAGPVTAYLQRSWDFLKAFEPPREEAYFTREYQQVLLEEEARAREAGTGFRFYIQPVGEPQTVIGSIGLNNVVWGAFRSAFLGYKLEEPRQGRGYMTMAVDMVVRHAFEDLGLHRIEANVMPRNKASLRVLEKNAFVNEGFSPYYLNINGVWEDHIHMVRINYALH